MDTIDALGDTGADPVVDAVAETEPAVPLGWVFCQPVGLTSNIGPDHDLGHRVSRVVVPVVPGPVPLR